MNLEEQSQQQVRPLGGLRAVGCGLVLTEAGGGPVRREGVQCAALRALAFPHQVRCSSPDATSGVPRLEGLLPTSGSFSYWKRTPKSSVLGLNLPLSLFQLIFLSFYLKPLKEIHHPSSHQWLRVPFPGERVLYAERLSSLCYSLKVKGSSHGPPTVCTELLSLGGPLGEVHPPRALFPSCSGQSPHRLLPLSHF